MYKIQVTYKAGSWDSCTILESQKTEEAAFMHANKFLTDNYISGAEIWVLSPNSKFWKVEDLHGRIVQRPVIEA